jgi:hypothetical protein
MALQEIQQKLSASKFTGFISPILDLIDKGVILRKGFWALYVIQAALCLLSPIIALIAGIGSGILKAPAGMVLALIIVWLIFTFACWLGFQVWWDRSKRIKNILKEGDEFVAIPLVAHFIKTSGESSAIVLIGGGVPMLVLLGIFSAVIKELRHVINIADMGIGLVFVAIVVGLAGYLILLISDFLAESINALASIANNTEKMANTNNVKKEIATPQQAED